MEIYVVDDVDRVTVQSRWIDVCATLFRSDLAAHLRHRRRYRAGECQVRKEIPLLLKLIEDPAVAFLDYREIESSLTLDRQ